MGLTTPRYALRYPIAADPDNVPSDMLALATDLDNKMSGFSTGILSARPAAGVTGRRYRATDTGYTYLDIGTAWVSDGRPQSDAAQTVLAYNAAWPTSPLDGQEVDRYSDSGNKQIWRFRYDGSQAAGSRWVFVGGAAAQFGVSSQDTSSPGGGIPMTATTTWTRIDAANTFTPGISGLFDTWALAQGHFSASVSGFLAMIQAGTTTATGPTPVNGANGTVSCPLLLTTEGQVVCRFSPHPMTAALPYTPYMNTGSACNAFVWLSWYVTPSKCG
jgi:hypothetical protein